MTRRDLFRLLSTSSLAIACLAGPSAATDLAPNWPPTRPTASIPGDQPPGWNLARPLMLLAAGGILAAVSWDEADPDGMARGLDRVGPTEALVDVGNTYGGGWFMGGSSVAVLAVGHASGNQNLQAFGSDLCRSLLFSTLVTTTVKYAVDRKRPSGGGLSFPSGHTSLAFSTVPVIAHHLGWQAGLAAGLVAIHTGLARLEDKNHFLSDVLAGAAIGLAVGDLVTQRRSRLAWTAGLAVTPRSLSYTIRF